MEVKKFLFHVKKKRFLLISLLLTCCCDDFDEINKAFNKEDILEQLELKKEIDLKKMEFLGEGCFGRTFKIKDRCLKIIKNDNISSVDNPTNNSVKPHEVTASDANLIAKVEEVSISEKIKEMKINKCQEIVNVITAGKYFFIVSKLYKGPTLEEYIDKNQYKNNQNLVLQHFLQIAEALKNLHEQKIIHMDLKSDNVIFEKEDCENLVIIDFGTAMIPDREGLKEQKGAIRNYSYNIAKDIIDEKPYNGEKYDIWCLGLILYHMVFGENLFPKYNAANIINGVFKICKKCFKR